MLNLLEKELQQTYQEIIAIKKDVGDAMNLFREAQIRTTDSKGGTVSNYQYFIYPFKGFTLANQGIHNTLAKYLAEMIPKDTEVILCIESDGIGIATLVAAQLRLPLIIAKTFHYDVECVTFSQQTGYYERTMYMSKALKNKKIAIVDCMASTGGTIVNMVKAVESINQETKITGIYCVNDKSNYRQKSDTFEKYDYAYLFDTYIENDKVLCSMSSRFKDVFWADVNHRFYNITERLAEDVSNKSRHGYGVGATLVNSETFEISAWGYRRGHVHAEQDALSMLKNNTPDWEEHEYMLYCTMEPCTYRNGKYTPCSHLISDMPQLKWVIIGQKDVADNRICGNGIQYLVENGKNIRLMATNEKFYANQNIFQETKIENEEMMLEPGLSFA